MIKCKWITIFDISVKGFTDNRTVNYQAKTERRFYIWTGKPVVRLMMESNLRTMLFNQGLELLEIKMVYISRA